VLASREGLWVLSPDEFAALVAHEIAHDYLWQEYRRARDRKDHQTMQELELRCAG
jgi:predicted SprT family Zn-dependent metalloprotease